MPLVDAVLDGVKPNDPVVPFLAALRFNTLARKLSVSSFLRLVVDGDLLLLPKGFLKVDFLVVFEEDGGNLIKSSMLTSSSSLISFSDQFSSRENKPKFFILIQRSLIALIIRFRISSTHSLVDGVNSLSSFKRTLPVKIW